MFTHGTLLINKERMAKELPLLQQAQKRFDKMIIKQRNLCNLLKQYGSASLADAQIELAEILAYKNQTMDRIRENQSATARLNPEKHPDKDIINHSEDACIAIIASQQKKTL